MGDCVTAWMGESATELSHSPNHPFTHSPISSVYCPPPPPRPGLAVAGGGVVPPPVCLLIALV
jgi:hypothetical protein